MMFIKKENYEQSKLLKEDSFNKAYNILCSGLFHSALLVSFKGSFGRLGESIYLTENDITTLKDQFSNSVKSGICHSRVYYNYGQSFLRSLRYAILSENSEVIDELCKPYLISINRNYDPMQNKLAHLYRVDNHLNWLHQNCKCFLAIVLDKYDALEKAINVLDGIYEQNTKKYKYQGLYNAYFKAMLTGKEEDLLSAYKGLYKKRKYLDASSYEDLNVVMTFLKKLALTKGHMIDFKAKDIAEDLVEIAPLDKYESYDWLDTLYYDGLEAYKEKFVDFKRLQSGEFMERAFPRDGRHTGLDIREDPQFQGLHQQYADDLGMDSPY